MMGIALFSIGAIGAFFVWFISIRPYVVAHGQGFRTGASFGVAIWVDWQSCGEIAKAENDEKGLKIYRRFGMFQLISVLGFVLAFCGV